MITTHTELLNALIEKYNLKSYLEIGINNPANNFDRIRCESKTGVDPEMAGPVSISEGSYISTKTSDQFFTAPRGPYDLIFIDGLHHADQVKRDFNNSLRCLSDNGFIVIHDVLPENEDGTLVPRQTKKWWGDVYKWAMSIGDYKGISFKTFNIDEGCMLVWKSGANNDHGKNLSITYNWNLYSTLGRILMNVTDEVII